MDFLRSMPKIELHAHLSGSVPIGFLNDLISDAVKAEVDYTYDYFPKVHSVLSSRGPLEKAIQKVFSDFRDDGVVYLELRSSPRVGLDYSKEDYIRLLVQIIQKEAQDFSPMMVKFLISIDRSKGLKGH